LPFSLRLPSYTYRPTKDTAEEVLGTPRREICGTPLLQGWVNRAKALEKT
jgi:hypothetical protein